MNSVYECAMLELIISSANNNESVLQSYAIQVIFQLLTEGYELYTVLKTVEMWHFIVIMCICLSM